MFHLAISLFFFTGCAYSPVEVILNCPTSRTIHSGQATFYNATGAGACSFDSSKTDLMVGAMNPLDYAGSQICGASVSVTGPSGTTIIRIVDLCPGCDAGDIDLSPQAFGQIADTTLGRVPITWYIVGGEVSGPILYHFMPTSSQYWTAVQIRQSRYPIYSLEYLTSPGTFTKVNRTDFNYFVQPTGMGKGPYTFRVTDIYGHVVIDSAIALTPGGSVSGHAQFPSCSQ
ncbi:MAG: expansin EXLX1 family cellulose-binding protein [Candidatus Kryptoniota bacterium]